MGLFGSNKASKGIRRGINEIKKLDIPGAEEFYLELDRMVELGEIDPDLAEAIFVEQTGMEGIEVDPALRQAQYDTMARLQEISEADGLDAQAEAKLRQARQLEDTRLAGDLGAIMEQAQRQGTGTAGMTQANKLLAAQSSANRMAQSGFDAAAEAERRALEALQARAALGGQMEERSFGQQAEIAKASDLINRFNTEQANRTNAANVAARNRAQELNLDRQYGIQEYTIGS